MPNWLSSILRWHTLCSYKVGRMKLCSSTTRSLSSSECRLHQFNVGFSKSSNAPVEFMSVDCRPSDVGLLAVTANNIITINKVGVC